MTVTVSASAAPNIETESVIDIVSLMVNGLAAEIEIVGEETEAGLAQGRMLTRMMMKIGTAVATRETAIGSVGTATEAVITTWAVRGLDPAPRAVIATTVVMTAVETAPAIAAETAAMWIAEEDLLVAPALLPRKLPRMTATSAPSSCSRSPSVPSSVTFDPSSRRLDLSLRRRLSQIGSLVDPKGKYPIPRRVLPLTLSSVGYVEFKEEESVAKALELTGQRLKGVPIIAQLAEAEKNRASRAVGEGPVPGTNNPGAPFHRLYVGNIHFSVTEDDLKQIFEPFGELEQVTLQRDQENPARSKGYGFVQ